MNIVSVHPSPLRVAYTDPTASLQLTERLGDYIKSHYSNRNIVVVCLGTDRSTGDSLGPLVGSALRKYHYPAFHLFGTLEEPVHAMNLDDTLERIHHSFHNPFVIGIDACLGRASSIGFIQIGEGPIRPGAGVHKELSPVGDIHISAVVNIGGYMENLVLQTTRLHLVMRMSELISRSVFRAVFRTCDQALNPCSDDHS